VDSTTKKAGVAPGRDREAIFFHAGWIAILAFATHWRFSFPLTPLVDRDFFGFLNPAIQALTGHGFQHTNNREFLYPGFVWVLLAVFRDFRVITIVQHLLGLATGLLLLASWRVVRGALPALHVPRWLYDLAGLVMFGIFVFAGQPVEFEHFIRPDVLCPFVAALGFHLLIRFLIARREGKGRAAFAFGAAGLFVVGVLPSLKPSFWLTVVFVAIPVWVALFDSRERILPRLLMIALPVMGVWLLLLLPEKHFSAADQRSASFLPESIFSIHALIIREQIASDVEHPDPGVPYPREKLRETLALLDAGLAAARRNSPTHMASLGYDADYLLNDDPFFATLTKADGGHPEPHLVFCQYYYRRTWRKRPGAMLGKVVRQLGLFYNLSCPAYCNGHFDMRKYYGRADELLKQPRIARSMAAWPPWREFRDAVAAAKDSAPTIAMPKLLKKTLDRLGNFYMPLLIGYLAAVPWLLCTARRRADFGLCAAVLAVGYAFNFGNNLGIAVLHTLEVSRYTYVQFATTILTEMLTAVFLAEIALHVFAPRFLAGKSRPPAGTEPVKA
jgi:hypothetical protein